MLEFDLWLIPPGLLILGMLLSWRHRSWPWRVASIVPLALAVYAIMPIWTVVFGTNLTEYDAIGWYLVRIVAAYGAALLLLILRMAGALAARLSRPTNETPNDHRPKTAAS